MSTWTDSGLNDPDYAAPATRGTPGSRRRIRLRGERLARAADHRWPSNHAHYMPEPCAEILTEWLYPLAEDYLALVAAVAQSVPLDEFHPDVLVLNEAAVYALRAALAASPVPEEQP